MNVGGLFSGIGGWELGLERAGMSVLWHCESEPYCQRVLARRFPGRPIYPDVRRLRGADLKPVDVLCGGFPCQDISSAGAKVGIGGARSGLWGEYARLVGELRPRYVLVENVAGLLTRGLGRVLGDLAALGYDAEWDCIPAAAVGAPHLRERVWLVGYPNEEGEPAQPVDDEASRLPALVADASSTRRARALDAANGTGSDAVLGGQAESRGCGELGRLPWWDVEPAVGRVANGIPQRVDRLRALGNALVPQIAEWIGRRIMTWEGHDPLSAVGATASDDTSRGRSDG